MSNDGLKTDQPLILAIETVTRAGGVAIARGESVLATLSGDPAVSHSTNLIEMIQQALTQAEAALTDIDFFAVAVGPGSFTGLRIGLATIKAFAVHLDRQVVGVFTLAAVAHASGAAGAIVSVLPAGRGEVFAQGFWSDDRELNAITEAEHLSPTEVAKKYDGLHPLTFTGEGVTMFRAEDTERNGQVIPAGNAPLAASVALLGFRAYREGKAVAPDELHAVYVRASDAEIKERWQQQKLQQQAHS